MSDDCSALNLSILISDIAVARVKIGALLANCRFLPTCRARRLRMGDKLKR